VPFGPIIPVPDAAPFIDRLVAWQAAILGGGRPPSGRLTATEIGKRTCDRVPVTVDGRRSRTSHAAATAGMPYVSAITAGDVAKWQG
jgi:hypothetical protein